jgi:hypothetical protein
MTAPVRVIDRRVNAKQARMAREPLVGLTTF